MAHQKAIRYVLQDGRDFYIYRDSECKDLQTTWTAPIRVCLDFNKAIQAREMCTKQLQLAGYEIVWPNPFASADA